MLPVQGQAEIIHNVCGALDKYESNLSEINQKVCMIFGKNTMPLLTFNRSGRIPS